MQKKITLFCLGIANILFYFLIGYIFVLCVCFADLKFCNSPYIFNGFIFKIAVSCFGICLLSFIYIFSKYISKKFDLNKWIFLLTSFLFVILCIFTYNYYFSTGWDAGLIIGNSCNKLNGGNIDTGYFSMYPNNLFLLAIETYAFKLFSILGISSDGFQFAFIVIQIFLLCISSILVYFSSYFLSSKKHVSFFAYNIFVILIGFSPWVSIIYSDSLGLIFPILILFLYSLPTQSALYKGIKWFFIGFISIIGFSLKPQIFIVFIAIVIIEFLFFIKDIACNNNTLIRKSILLLCIPGIILGSIVSNSLIDSLNVKLNEEAAFGMTHWLMMGFNESVGYNAEDVAYSASFLTKKERSEANIAEVKQRIKDYGLKGVVDLFNRKTIYNFNDATFSWSGEGHFFMSENSKNNILASFLKRLYYPQCQSKLRLVYNLILQSVWYGLFCLILVSFLIKKDKKIYVLIVSLLGLILFETLFEARARYIYIYAPLFILIASLGAQKIEMIFKAFLIKISNY